MSDMGHDQLDLATVFEDDAAEAKKAKKEGASEGKSLQTRLTGGVTRIHESNTGMY
eukprot:COSAG01_NODE_1236_length_11101_cov_6.515179_14_plen_55_part_01